MKKSSILLIACLLLSWSSKAQDSNAIQQSSVVTELDKKKEVFPSNQVKVNLATILWNTGSINYEKRISNRWTVGLTANYRPKGKPPFKSTLQKLFGDKNKSYLDNAFDIHQLEYSNWSISPEFKFYFNKANAFKGFYIAAFAKYEHIDMQYDLPLSFDASGYTIQTKLPLEGSVQPWSGGIYIGHQWQLAKNWYLDWQIIGGNFGVGKLEMYANQSLTDKEQEKIKAFAEEIQEELSDLNYEVNNQGAKIWGNIPWAGLRTGLSIGFVF